VALHRSKGDSQAVRKELLKTNSISVFMSAVWQNKIVTRYKQHFVLVTSLEKQAHKTW
jgi:hypothetical protein